MGGGAPAGHSPGRCVFFVGEVSVLYSLEKPAALPPATPLDEPPSSQTASAAANDAAAATCVSPLFTSPFPRLLPLPFPLFFFVFWAPPVLLGGAEAVSPLPLPPVGAEPTPWSSLRASRARAAPSRLPPW